MKYFERHAENFHKGFLTIFFMYLCCLSTEDLSGDCYGDFPNSGVPKKLSYPNFRVNKLNLMNSSYFFVIFLIQSGKYEVKNRFLANLEFSLWAKIFIFWPKNFPKKNAWKLHSISFLGTSVIENSS
jgi:hypothetical protein